MVVAKNKNVESEMNFLKKVYLVHCWSGSIQDGWYPWIKKHLENNNIEVVMENMPNTDEPSINEWVSKLENLVPKLDEETFFIGHSIGCQAIMRYIETKNVTKIGGILFVAPWLDLLPLALEDGADEVADEWIHTPIDFEKISKFTNNITAIFSTDDYFVSIVQEKEFKNKLNAKTILVQEKGHISGEDGIKELPEALLELGKMLRFELLEIVDSNDNLTGEILDKELAHDNNILHREVGIFIFNSKKELLIQKRAATKRMHPNCWGLCAGHVDAFEDTLTAALREMKEEIGVVANKEDVILFDKVVKQRPSNSHITYQYYMYLDNDIEDFIIQEEELSEVKWISFTDYKNKVINNDSTITLTNNEDNLNMLEKLETVLNSNY